MHETGISKLFSAKRYHSETSLGRRWAQAHSPNSLGQEQREQLSDPARTDAGVELGELLGAELGPTLVLLLDATLATSTRRYR
jgi:hypothetical protein